MGAFAFVSMIGGVFGMNMKNGFEESKVSNMPWPAGSALSAVGSCFLDTMPESSHCFRPSRQNREQTYCKHRMSILGRCLSLPCECLEVVMLTWSYLVTRPSASLGILQET